MCAHGFEDASDEKNLQLCESQEKATYLKDCYVVMEEFILRSAIFKLVGESFKFFGYLQY